MRIALIMTTVSMLLSGAATACPPPPPGWVPPTQEQRLERSLTGATDIVYGVVTRSGSVGSTSRFKVLHVYRGGLKKGSFVEAKPGWGHPTPVCAGMMGPPHPRPFGAYGVIAFNAASPELNFIQPEDVQIMIREGWIRSAQAR
jgi:hypothetical protein